MKKELDTIKPERKSGWIKFERKPDPLSLMGVGHLMMSQSNRETLAVQM
jgi:hypothetical protein